MKKELNLQLDAHINLLQDTALKEISGIDVKEILELRKLYKKDHSEYFNRIKLKYVVSLGMLGLAFRINQKIESIVFHYIHYLIQELPAEQHNDSNSKVTFSFS